MFLTGQNNLSKRAKPPFSTATGCAAVNLNPSDASAAGLLARQFADAIKAALGTDTATALLAPREGSALAALLDSFVRAIRADAHAADYHRYTDEYIKAAGLAMLYGERTI